jgi:prolyl oligopeptidase
MAAGGSAAGSTAYPEAPAEGGVEEAVANGARVTDPFRALEDTASAGTSEWVRKQAALFESYVKAEPAEWSEKFTKAIAGFWSYGKLGALRRQGEWWYGWRRLGLENQSVLVRCREPLPAGVTDGVEGFEVFLDLNAEYPDGKTSATISAWSEEGAYLAYGLARAGSDWCTVSVRSAATGRDLPDRVPWVKYSSIAWLHDSSAFLYACYDAPEQAVELGTETTQARDQCVKLHVLGTPAESDLVVWRDRANPLWLFGVDVTDDGRYVLVTPRDGCDPSNRLYYLSVERLQRWAASRRERGSAAEAEDEAARLAPLVRMVDEFTAEYVPVASRWEAAADGSSGGRTAVLLRTNEKGAQRFKLIAVSLADGDGGDADVVERSRAAMRDAVEVLSEPEGSGVLESACVCACNTATPRLCTVELRDVVSHAHVYPMRWDGPVARDGGVAVVTPAPGDVSGFFGRHDDSLVVFSFTSMLHPSEVWALDVTTGEAAPRLVFRPSVPGFNPDEYESFQSFFPSADGTRIPLFVARPKASASASASASAPAPAPTPLLLYGYGGFQVSMTPYFSPVRLGWMSVTRGAFAVANLRGGGEYGEDWHQGGWRKDKHKVFEDFEAAARFVVREGWTEPGKIVIMGGSNGGLLTLACALRAPDLFGCVISQVPVTDMLRFHKSTIGSAWRSEYGDPDDADMVDYLLSYSPYHKALQLAHDAPRLPPILITTADHDDRVSPWHTYKVLAALQRAARPGDHPRLARIDLDAGHGAGKPTSMIIAEYAEVFAFARQQLH